jgi:hypothetical protein
VRRGGHALAGDTAKALGAQLLCPRLRPGFAGAPGGRGVARENNRARRRKCAGAEALGVFVYPSEANFLLCDFGRTGALEKSV